MNSTYADNLTLVQRCHEGDRQAEAELVERNSPLVWKMVHRMKACAANSSADEEDLYQLGAMGLVKAARNFDSALGTQFSTYAVPLILGEMRRFLRDDGMVKVSRVLRQRGRDLKRVGERLTEQTGREPTLTELAETAGLTEEEAAEAMCAAAPYSSFSQPVGSEGSMTLGELIPGSGGEEEWTEHLWLKQAVAGLTWQEQAVVRGRYVSRRTQKEVASELHITQVQVSRMERRILKKLRERMIR